jgi:hypothetical protein
MGATTLVSANTNGVAGNSNSFSPLIDDSGRYVLFFSGATDLTATHASAIATLYFRDLQSNTTYLLPVIAGKAPTNSVAMTPDGHYVAYASQAVCLWNSQADALVYSNTIANVNAVAVSPDGNRLAYIAGTQLYAEDRAAQSNWVVATKVPANRGIPQFSGDSRYLVYVSTAALVANDTNQTNDVYRYDFQEKTNVLISQSGEGNAGSGASDWPAISWNGRYVAYRSLATNFVSFGASAFPQIYLYDSQTGSNSLVSISALSGNAGNNRSLAPAFSGDSTTLFIRSWASDLLSNNFSGSSGIYALTVSPPALLCEIGLSPGGVPVISWPAAAGTNFQAQYKNNLTDPAWLPVSGNVTIVSNTESITDTSPSGAQRFYRLQSN